MNRSRLAFPNSEVNCEFKPTFGPVILDVMHLPTSEDSGHIQLDGDVIRYTSSTHSEWTLRVDDLRIIGEATDQNGPFADDYFLCFATGPEMWHEASFYAAGRDSFLAALGARLGVTFQLNLSSTTDFASRILWPLELADQPMFQHRDVPPKTMVGRLLGSMKNTQTYSEHVLAVLNKR